jgi:hypothetical protein
MAKFNLKSRIELLAAFQKQNSLGKIRNKKILNANQLREIQLKNQIKNEKQDIVNTMRCAINLNKMRRHYAQFSIK